MLENVKCEYFFLPETKFLPSKGDETYTIFDHTSEFLAGLMGEGSEVGLGWTQAQQEMYGVCSKFLDR